MKDFNERIKTFAKSYLNDIPLLLIRLLYMINSTPWRGVEPPALSLGRICSIQLSYQGTTILYQNIKIYSRLINTELKKISTCLPNEIFCLPSKNKSSAIKAKDITLAFNVLIRLTEALTVPPVAKIS